MCSYVNLILKYFDKNIGNIKNGINDPGGALRIIMYASHLSDDENENKLSNGSRLQWLKLLFTLSEKSRTLIQKDVLAEAIVQHCDKRKMKAIYKQTINEYMSRNKIDISQQINALSNQ